MHIWDVRERVDGPHPEVPPGLDGDGLERIARLDGADLDRPLGGGDGAKRLRQAVGEGQREVALGAQRLRGRDLGHRVLVFEALFFQLKRRLEAEDGLALLHGVDAAGDEALAVAQPVDGVDDRALQVARADEVPVERVHRAVRRDGLRGGGERLAQHLAAEDGAPAEVLAVAAEEVAVEALEGEEIDEVGQQSLHGRLQGLLERVAGARQGPTPGLSSRR